MEQFGRSSSNSSTNSCSIVRISSIGIRSLCLISLTNIDNTLLGLILWVVSWVSCLLARLMACDISAAENKWAKIVTRSLVLIVGKPNIKSQPMSRTLASIYIYIYIVSYQPTAKFKYFNLKEINPLESIHLHFIIGEQTVCLTS